MDGFEEVNEFEAGRMEELEAVIGRVRGLDELVGKH
jgi:hypothetical protein